jgi:hypothetical protein
VGKKEKYSQQKIIRNFKNRKEVFPLKLKAKKNFHLELRMANQ